MFAKNYVSLFVALLFTLNAVAQDKKPMPPVPGQESHGADAFEVGGKLQLFDKLEHQKSFKPAKLDPFTKYVVPIIKRMKEILPRTGRHLEARFTRGIEPAWYFVEVPLKDIKDEGPTVLSPLVLTWNKIQIAANKGTSVYIDEPSYKKLPDDETRAYLLMHESVISAIGVELVKDGSQVREITGLLFNENFMDYTAEELSRNIKKLVGNKESLLYQYAEMDISGAKVASAKTGWEDVSTTSDGKSTHGCLDASDQCVFKDTISGLFWSAVNPGT